MVGPSKILTVSYGTFSCTLEGFDEPFSTMKAIAEYFRDLAADDRYFGAEPPTPDAEMLHRIAEREIKRRVEAKIQDNGVVLRPHIEGPVASPEVGAAPVDSPAPAAGAGPVEAAPAAFAPSPAYATAEGPPPDIGTIAGISEKLQRIRAAVAQARAIEADEAQQRAPDDEAVHAEAERLAVEEAERAEAERLAVEEAERAEAERLAAEEAERAEAERPRRRVVVVRPAAAQPRATPEPAPADENPAPADTPQDEAESIETRVARALGDTGLADEDEAELLRELVAVEREAEEMRAAERRRRDVLEETQTDAAVDRLISQADSHLSEPEARRRQSTISHLKAAVAATRAEATEGSLRDTSAEATDMARYREDLARSVRPDTDDAEAMLRRPQRPAAARTERPRNVQPPLVLVSEQRIDRHAEPEVVRPRRISAGALAMEELFDEDEAPAPAHTPGRTFVEFIAPHNLTALAEMIEAAAAYVTQIDGSPEFTRPQVMRHVVNTGHPMARSREDLLRAFGLLMRQGMIRRSRRGQFELSQESDFIGLARRFAQRG